MSLPGATTGAGDVVTGSPAAHAATAAGNPAGLNAVAAPAAVPEAAAGGLADAVLHLPHSRPARTPAVTTSEATEGSQDVAEAEGTTATAAVPADPASIAASAVGAGVVAIARIVPAVVINDLAGRRSVVVLGSVRITPVRLAARNDHVDIHVHVLVLGELGLLGRLLLGDHLLGRGGLVGANEDRGQVEARDHEPALDDRSFRKGLLLTVLEAELLGSRQGLLVDHNELLVDRPPELLQLTLIVLAGGEAAVGRHGDVLDLSLANGRSEMLRLDRHVVGRDGGRERVCDGALRGGLPLEVHGHLLLVHPAPGDVVELGSLCRGRRRREQERGNQRRRAEFRREHGALLC